MTRQTITAPDMQGMSVLVTGGAGFVGSHTVDALVAAGARVVVVDNLLTGRKQNLNASAGFYELNIANDRFDQVLEQERPDVIYHFAFHVLVPKSMENPLLDVDAIMGSLRMLQKAAKLRIKKIVFASSGFLYGNTNRLPATEATPADPVSPYVVAKHAVENYLRVFHRAYGLPYVILRYPAVYGPRQWTGAMADYIRKLSAGGQAEIYGDGSKTRDYVYVEDVVEANMLALGVAPDHPDPVFNVGTGVETTLNDLYGKIARLLGVVPSPVYRPDRPGEQLRHCLDHTKAAREMGWHPRTQLDTGLVRTVQAHTLGPVLA